MGDRTVTDLLFRNEKLPLRKGSFFLKNRGEMRILMYLFVLFLLYRHRRWISLNALDVREQYSANFGCVWK